MKYPNNLRKQAILMDECARFLISKERVAPSSTLHDNSLWINWRKQERKKLERFAKYFDPKYFADSVSIWNKFKIKHSYLVDYSRVDAVMIMRAFYKAGILIKHFAFDNLTAHHRSHYDEELDLVASEYENLIVEIAEKAWQLEVKQFAINQIYDMDVLKDFVLRRDRILAKMALRRIDQISELYEESLNRANGHCTRC